MKILSKIAWVLVVVGALNWGLVGALSFDLVKWISMGSGAFATTVYVLVGLSAVWVIVAAMKKPASAM
ncbi:MAG: DUF378 domain-containing protein [bacterium]